MLPYGMNKSEKTKDAKKGGKYEWRYRPDFDSALERLPTDELNIIKRKFKKRARQRVHILSCKIVDDGFQPNVDIVPRLRIRGHKNEQQIGIELQEESVPTYSRTAVLLIMKR